ncbi:MAG: hypothetical protein ACYSYV_12180 [Planctomycetota bacterium]|jgi:hypothetical protein
MTMQKMIKTLGRNGGILPAAGGATKRDFNTDKAFYFVLRVSAVQIWRLGVNGRWWCSGYNG